MHKYVKKTKNNTNNSKEKTIILPNLIVDCAEL